MRPDECWVEGTLSMGRGCRRARMRCLWTEQQKQTHFVRQQQQHPGGNLMCAVAAV